MSDSKHKTHDWNRSTPVSETTEDSDVLKKSFSDPKLLFRRPRRRHILRPNGMVMTRLDGTRHMLYDNPENDPQGYDSLLRRTVSRQSRREGARSSEGATSEGCSTEVTDLEEHSENEESNSWSDSEENDTDLDTDTTVNQLFTRQKTWQDRCGEEDDKEERHDLIRLKEYEQGCEKEQAIPQTAILQNIGHRDLDLRHRNVGGKHLKPLFKALKDNMRVQRLLLDENGLDEDAMESLANGLRDNVTLSYLSLAGNPLGSNGLAHVVHLLLTNKIIQGLDLSDTKLGTDSILLLAHLLKGNDTLKFLDLSRNTLEESMIRFLAAAIGENNGLEFLRLSWNNIRHSGAAAVGQSITVNDTLRVLDISWNGLGYKGAVALSTSLKDNQTLRELDISHNNINWQGALVLSSAVAVNSTLKILRVGCNPLTTTGANDLVEAASSPECNLRMLDITDVPVIFETEVLASSINQSRSFRLHHGGVVFIHDSIGRRLDREKKPMERLLGHLKDRMIRPLEMLREFDKQNSGVISQSQFIARLKKANVPLHAFEIRALAASVSEIQLDGTTKINYKKLIDGVENHILEDRMRKIKDRVYKKRVHDYHTRILSDSKPLYSNALSYTLDTPSAMDMHSGRALSSMSSDRISKSVGAALVARDSSRSVLSSGKMEEQPQLPSLKKQGKVFKMSQPLDQIGVKTKKKAKKRKKARMTGLASRETTTLVGCVRGDEIKVS